MESGSRGKRERGTKAVVVKLQSKKVEWRLSDKGKIFYVSYIEASINKGVRRSSCLEGYCMVRVDDNFRSRYYNPLKWLLHYRYKNEKYA